MYNQCHKYNEKCYPRSKLLSMSTIIFLKKYHHISNPMKIKTKIQVITEMAEVDLHSLLRISFKYDVYFLQCICNDQTQNTN